MLYKLYVVNQINYTQTIPMFFNKWLVYKKKVPSHGVFFSTKAAAQVATKGILHSSSFRTLEILNSASLCRKWGEEQLWMDVDGNAKSESPVDRWFLDVFLMIFIPFFGMGFNHPFGGAGFCAAIHSITVEMKSEMMIILSGRVNHTSGTVEKNRSLKMARWIFNKTPLTKQLTMLAPPVMAAWMNGFSESWVVYICLHIPSGYVKIAIENDHRNSGFSH